MVHLLNLTGRGRGPIDLLSPFESGLVIETTTLILIAFLFLMLGLGGAGKIVKDKVSVISPKLYISTDYSVVVALIAITLGVLGWSKVGPYAALVGTKRIISIDGGLARYAYITSWLSWGIVIFAIYLLSKIKRKYLSYLVLVLMILLVAKFTNWNGSRSALFLICAPVVFTLFASEKFERKHNYSTLLGLALCYGLFSRNLLVKRIANEGQTNFSIVSLLDWELGRFSSLGRTISIAKENGFELGSTFLNSLGSILSGVLKVFGYTDASIWSDTLSIQQIIGSSVLGSAQKIYLVPGFIAETYINFGIFGIACVYFVFGIALKNLLSRVTSSSEVFERIYITYLIFALSFNLILNSSIGLLSQTLIDILPLHVLMLLRFLKKRSLV
jgi:hypothetical protein